MPGKDELMFRLEERRPLFARPMPPAWASEWAHQLAQRPDAQEERPATSLIFRLRHVRLALPSKIIRSVSPLLPVCRMPQYPPAAFMGLVAVGGEIAPCCSLARLLNLPGVTAGASARTVVLEQRSGEFWAFFTDEVLAVAAGEERPRDVSDAHPEIARGWSDAVFESAEGQKALLLKPKLVFEAMRNAVE